jgi:hypothetical protein
VICRSGSFRGPTESRLSFQPARDHVPIYDVVQNSLDVIGATVLIIEIIGMLPHVETNEGGHIFRQRTIAARGGARTDKDLAPRRWCNSTKLERADLIFGATRCCLHNPLSPGGRQGQADMGCDPGHTYPSRISGTYAALKSYGVRKGV